MVLPDINSAHPRAVRLTRARLTILSERESLGILEVKLIRENETTLLMERDDLVHLGERRPEVALGGRPLCTHHMPVNHDPRRQLRNPP